MFPDLYTLILFSIAQLDALGKRRKTLTLNTVKNINKFDLFVKVLTRISSV